MRIVQKCEENEKKVTYGDLQVGTVFVYSNITYLKLRDGLVNLTSNLYTHRDYSSSGGFELGAIIVKPNARVVLE